VIVCVVVLDAAGAGAGAGGEPESAAGGGFAGGIAADPGGTTVVGAVGGVGAPTDGGVGVPDTGAGGTGDTGAAGPPTVGTGAVGTGAVGTGAVGTGAVGTGTVGTGAVGTGTIVTGATTRIDGVSPVRLAPPFPTDRTWSARAPAAPATSVRAVVRTASRFPKSMGSIHWHFMFRNSPAAVSRGLRSVKGVRPVQARPAGPPPQGVRRSAPGLRSAWSRRCYRHRSSRHSARSAPRCSPHPAHRRPRWSPGRSS
jgi:hypothetical protein